MNHQIVSSTEFWLHHKSPLKSPLQSHHNHHLSQKRPPLWPTTCTSDLLQVSGALDLRWCRFWTWLWMVGWGPKKKNQKMSFLTWENKYNYVYIYIYTQNYHSLSMMYGFAADIELARWGDVNQLMRTIGDPLCTPWKSVIVCHRHHHYQEVNHRTKQPISIAMFVCWRLTPGMTCLW